MFSSGAPSCDSPFLSYEVFLTRALAAQAETMSAVELVQHFIEQIVQRSCLFRLERHAVSD